MHDKPWYHEGLQFMCLGCGRCCTGDPGFVWVNQAEIQSLAKALGLPTAEFERVFIRSVGTRKSLIELPGGDCALFDRSTRRCKAYAARPRQCRTWPFWESNLRSPADWQQTCRYCPGSGAGRTVALREIEAQVQLFRL